MLQQNQIIKVPEKIMTVFEDSDAIRQFEAILHTRTNAFIRSALIVIADSPDLMNCTPQSLVSGTLRSATLGLSLDPALRQAYLVPRPLKNVWTACFQPPYHALYHLAVRSDEYRHISVIPIQQGGRVIENPQTGIHYWTRGGSDVLFSPVQGEGGLKAENMRDVTGGKPTSAVIGYLGYFKTLKGFEKSVWMTIPEIHKHALTWSPGSYNSAKGGWQDARKRPVMEMKTVFIALSKFMDLSGDESRNLKDAIEEDLLTEPEEMIDAQTEPVYVDIQEEEVTKPKRPAKDIIAELTGENFEQDFPQPEGAVTELIVESTAPGPQRAVRNDIITDSAWENFTRLVEKANKAGIVTRSYNRNEMTATLVYGQYNDLSKRIAKLAKK